MKKSVVFFSMILILICCIPAAYADLIYTQDFESTNVGSFPSDFSAYARGHNISVVDNQNHYGTIAINMSESTGSPYFDKAGLAISSESKTVIEFSVMVENSDTKCENIVAVKNSAGDVARLIKVKDGVMNAGNGATVKRLTEKHFYNIAIVVDTEKKQYSVYIDGTLKANKIGLGTYSSADIDAFRVMTMSLQEGCTNQFSVDNIMIYSGAAPATEEEKKTYLTENSTDASGINAVRNRVKNVLFLYEGTENMFYKAQVKQNDAKAFYKNNDLYIPLRSVMQTIGASVDYNNDTGEISVASEQNKKVFTDSDEGICMVDGKAFISATQLANFMGAYAQIDKTGFAVIGDEKYFYDWNKDKKILLETIAQLNYKNADGYEIAADVIKNSGGQHPRIVGTREDFDLISDAVENRMEPITKWFEEIKKKSDSALSEKPYEFKMQDSLRALNRIREVMNRIVNLGVTYQVTEDEKYAERGVAELLAFCGDELWSDWNPYQMLGIGEAAYAAGAGYDLFYSYMTEEQRKFVREKINEKAFVHYKNDYFDLSTSNGGVGRPEPYTDILIRSSLFRHYKQRNNWTIIVNGGIMAAALSMCDDADFRAVAEEILGYTMLDVLGGIEGFSPDGAWYEGSNYWDYTMQYFAKMCRALDNSCKTDYGISNAPAIKLTGDFIYGLQGPGGVFNFSDAPETYMDGSDSIFWLAKRFNNSRLTDISLRFMNYHNIFASAEGIVDFVKAPQTDEHTNGSLDNYWRKIETVTLRNSWDDSSSNFIGIHAGSNADEHAQLDTGTIVLDAMGKRFISDLGAENYNLKSGAGTGGWLLYRSNPQGHNLLCFNPSTLDYGQDLKGEAKIERFESNKVDALAITDLSNVWKTYVTEYKRGIRLTDERNVFILQDEYKLKPNVEELYWFIHTKGDIELTDNGKSAVITIDNVELKVEPLTDCDGEFVIMDALPMPGSASEKIVGQNQNTQFKKLAFRFNTIKDGTFAVAMIPLNKDVPTEYQLPQLQPLDDWVLNDDSHYEEKNPMLLSQIYIDGNPIENFDPYTNSYEYSIPFGKRSVPKITTAEETQILLPEQLGDAVTIIAGEGSTQNIYTVRFIRETSLELTADVYENIPKEIIASAQPQTQNGKGNVADNDLTTRWSAFAPCHIVYDLGEKTTINYIGLAYYLGSERQTAIEISVSDDGENWRSVSYGNSSGLTDNLEYYDVNSVSARYVKVKGLDSPTGWISITEFKVYTEKNF